MTQVVTERPQQSPMTEEEVAAAATDILRLLHDKTNEDIANIMCIVQLTLAMHTDNPAEYIQEMCRWTRSQIGNCTARPVSFSSN